MNLHQKKYFAITHPALCAFLLIVGFTLYLTNPDITQAQNCEDINCSLEEQSSTDYFNCINSKQSCLEKKISETQKEAGTLKNTINIINGQISIQQLQINQTSAEIDQLNKEIEDLGTRINGLGLSLDRLSNILIERIRSNYKYNRQPIVFTIIGSKSFSELVNQAKYLSLAEKQTAKAMQKTESQRLAYDEQKQLKLEKQEQVEEKKLSLVSEKQKLDNQKVEKQTLLTITKNNEQRYQNLLEEARKELAQISNAANVVIREGEGIAVKKGETIGTMGNSGFSTGAHLHFAVYKYSRESFGSNSKWNWYYSNYVNPLDKLKKTSVRWATDCSFDSSGTQESGSGTWDWPMSNPTITQNYGSNTCYNWMYNGNPHPALDMVSTFNISVKAVADGEAFFCRNCLGDGGNGVFVFHDDDYMTLYWHLK